MADFVKTERLHLTQLDNEDASFIYQLVNSSGWLTYIGDRNIRSIEDAENYLQKIIQKPNVVYWTVKLLSNNSKIGIVTYIKRDYLEHHDIGFAFLPEFTKNGYAYEAAKIILEKVNQENEKPIILATTKPENTASIKLLEKLGLFYDREIQVDQETLLVFSSDKHVK